MWNGLLTIVQSGQDWPYCITGQSHCPEKGLVPVDPTCYHTLFGSRNNLVLTSMSKNSDDGVRATLGETEAATFLEPQVLLRASQFLPPVPGPKTTAFSSH